MQKRCELCGMPLRLGRCINPNCVDGAQAMFVVTEDDNKGHILTSIGLDKDWSKDFVTHPNLGCVMKVDDFTWRIFCEPTWQGSGIDITEATQPFWWKLVPLYTAQHPEKVIASYSDPTWPRRSREKRIAKLKQYLADTDYMVTKCTEIGAAMSELYPEAHAKRAKAREDINRLQEELSSLEES